MLTNSEAAERLQLVSTLLGGFPRQGNSSPESVARAYMLAVDEFPNEAIHAAVHRFIRGEVPGRNNAFLPSAAEFAGQCRLLEKAIAVERKQSAARLGSTGKVVEFPVEHRKEMQRQLALLASGGLGTTKEAGGGNS